MLLDRQVAHTLPIHRFYEPRSNDIFQVHKVDLCRLLLRISLKHLLNVSFHWYTEYAAMRPIKTDLTL